MVDNELDQKTADVDELTEKDQLELRQLRAENQKLKRLLTLRAEIAAKIELVDREIAAVVLGEEGIGAKLTRIKAFWCETWQEAYKEQCDFDHRSHTAALKRWLAKDFTEAQITTKMFHYLIDRNPFYVKERHPFPLFIHGFNSFKGVSVDEADSHSADKAREMRGA